MPWNLPELQTLEGSGPPFKALVWKMLAWCYLDPSLVPSMSPQAIHEEFNARFHPWGMMDLL